MSPATAIRGEADFLASRLSAMLERARGAPVRSLRRFAEEEIVVPDGPYEGERLRLERSPYLATLFDAIDEGLYTDFVWTGSVQSAKTLALVVVLMWHLFEHEESVVFGLPTIEIFEDKWFEDILPVINKSRYRSLLPTTGTGARGGSPSKAVRFRHGVTLKPMSGGGGDEKRSAYTARVVVITELDKMDDASAVSRETDKVSQIRSRNNSYGDDARTYGEGTVSLETGRTWQEVTTGLDVRIAHRCPECECLSIVGREHLVGWQDAESEWEANENARFVCPACGVEWSESQRREAVLAGVTVRKGERISEDGRSVVGEPDRTLTFGIRWDQSHSFFHPIGKTAVKEWRAARAKERGDEGRHVFLETELKQFQWTTPVVLGLDEGGELAPSHVARRLARTGRGELPPGVLGVTIGADVGKHAIYWVALAVVEGPSLLIPDYGVIELHTQTTPVEDAIPRGIDEMEEYIWDTLGGFGVAGDDENRLYPCMRAVDSNYMKKPALKGVRAINAARGARCAIGTRGRGSGQYSEGRPVSSYRHPTKTTKETTHIGDGLHVRYERDVSQSVVEVNADRWKMFVHERLRLAGHATGSLVLYNADQRTHQSIAHHLTAEQPVEDVNKEGVVVTKFVRKRAANHYLDALSLACVAASMVGLIGEDPAPKWGDRSQMSGETDGPAPKRATPAETREPARRERSRGRFNGPGGSAYFVGDRR